MFSYTIGCAFRAFPDSFSFSCHETAPTAKNKQGRETVIIMIYKHPEIQSSSSSLGVHGDWFLQISHQVKKEACLRGFKALRLYFIEESSQCMYQIGAVSMRM